MTCKPMWLVAVVGCIAWSAHGQNTDSPTDAGTDDPTEAPTEAPTPTPAPTEPPTEAPTEPGEVATFYSDIRVLMFDAFDTADYKNKVMSSTSANPADVTVTVTYLMTATYAFGYAIPANQRAAVFAQSLQVPENGIQVQVSRRLAEDGERRLSDTTYQVTASTQDAATANNMEDTANNLGSLQQSILDNTGATVTVPSAPTLTKDVKIVTEVAINSNTQSQSAVESAFSGLDQQIVSDGNVVSTTSYVSTGNTPPPTPTPTAAPTNPPVVILPTSQPTVSPTVTPTSTPTDLPRDNDDDVYYADDNHAVGLGHSLALLILCLAIRLQ